MRLTKRAKANGGLVDKKKRYSVSEAVEVLKKAAPVKFDSSVDVQMKLGANPNESTQVVRGTTGLPHGTGKKVRVVVLTKDESGKAAEQAGADHVGGNDLIEKIEKGWTDFDAVIATPTIMREIAKLGKVLGPRGLMPSPKAGTVTENVAQAVKEIKKGRIEFKMDKQSNLHCQVGKLSFSNQAIQENVQTLINAVAKAKPKDIKGEYIVSVHLSSSMGPGIRLDDTVYRGKESAGE